MTNRDIAWSELSAILGEGALREATAADAVDGVTPRRVAEPASAEALAGALRWASAAGIRVVPRGGGTKLGWGNPPAGCDLVLSTARLAAVREHAWADMTVVVEAGCRIVDLQETLRQHGQHLALDPLWPERATVGGVLSANDSGSLRFRYGSLRDLVIGVTVALADGTLAKSGGKVVKNVAGYDLPKLFTGALGTLGVIVEAVFRLHPLPRQTRSLSVSGTPEALNRLLLAILASRLTPISLQLRAAAEGAVLDVRFDGTEAGIAAQVAKLHDLTAAPLPPLVAADSPAGVWHAHQDLWDQGVASATPTPATPAHPAAPAPPAVTPALLTPALPATLVIIAKLSVLPAHLAAACALVERHARERSLAWRLVLQGVGAGLVRLEGPDEPALRAAFLALRDELAAAGGDANLGGTIVALGCPPAVKRGFDVWGAATDAQPVMVRLKQRFDPTGTLSPGRFVGGI